MPNVSQNIGHDSKSITVDFQWNLFFDRIFLCCIQRIEHGKLCGLFVKSTATHTASESIAIRWWILDQNNDFFFYSIIFQENLFSLFFFFLFPPSVSSAKHRNKHILETIQFNVTRIDRNNQNILAVIIN